MTAAVWKMKNGMIARQDGRSESRDGESLEEGGLGD